MSPFCRGSSLSTEGMHFSRGFNACEVQTCSFLFFVFSKRREVRPKGPPDTSGASYWEVEITSSLALFWAFRGWVLTFKLTSSGKCSGAYSLVVVSLSSSCECCAMLTVYITPSNALTSRNWCSFNDDKHFLLNTFTASPTLFSALPRHAFNALNYHQIISPISIFPIVPSISPSIHHRAVERLKLGRSGFKIQLYHLLALEPWAKCYLSDTLSK